MEKNIENTCRACLRQQSSLKNLLSEYTEGSTGIKLSHIFQSCTNIQLPPEEEPDALPQMICIMCELTLKTCYYFRLQCKQTNDEYSTIYNKPEYADSEMVKEEERLEYEFIKENAIETELKESLSLSDDDMNDAEVASIEYNDDPGTSSVVKESPIPVPVKIIKRNTYKCNKCPKTFMSQRYLEIHKKIHQNQKYSCEICGKNFLSKSLLRIHLEKHSTDESDMDLNLMNIIELKPNSKVNAYEMKSEGIKRKRKTKRIKKKCQECQKMFSDGPALRKHTLAVHLGKKPFACINCNHLFVAKQNLKIHLNKKYYQAPCNEHILPNDIDNDSYELSITNDQWYLLNQCPADDKGDRKFLNKLLLMVYGKEVLIRSSITGITRQKVPGSSWNHKDKLDETKLNYIRNLYFKRIRSRCSDDDEYTTKMMNNFFKFVNWKIENMRKIAKRQNKI